MNRLICNLLALALVCTQLTACVGLLIAGAVGGASVAMDRRDVGANADDKQIGFRITNLVAERYPQVHVNNESFNRVVLLTGEVPSIEIGRQVEALVRSVPNVKNVVNELAVGEPSDITSRTKDTAITAKIKAFFLEDRLIQSSAFVVTTERGNVYLQGRITQAEGARASEIARTVSGVRQVVKVFDYLSDEQFKQLGK